MPLWPRTVPAFTWQRLCAVAVTAVLGMATWGPGALGQASPTDKAKEKVGLFADHVVHDKQGKQFIANGRVRVVQSDVSVYADAIVYDERTETSTSSGPAKIVHKDGARETLITASRLVFNHKERHVILQGPVRVDRPADASHTPAPPGDDPAKKARLEAALKAARSVITSDKGEYWTKTKVGVFSGNVVILQKEKKATSETATLDDPKGLMVLEGKAHVEQIKGNWLVNEGIVQEDPNDTEQKLALRRTATVDGKRIELYTKTNDMIATGDVVVEQKKQLSKSQKAVYRDKDQLLTLTDDVRFERPEKDWMTADRAVYDLNREQFQAFGDKQQITSSMIVKTDPTPEPEIPAEAADHELGPAPVVPTPASGPPPLPGAIPSPHPSTPPSDLLAKPSPVPASNAVSSPRPVGSDAQIKPVVVPPSLLPSAAPSRQPRLPQLPRATASPTKHT